MKKIANDDWTGAGLIPGSVRACGTGPGSGYGEWFSRAYLPTAVAQAAAVEVSSIVYFAGGSSGTNDPALLQA
jgi:hypothetical protein